MKASTKGIAWMAAIVLAAACGVAGRLVSTSGILPSTHEPVVAASALGATKGQLAPQARCGSNRASLGTIGILQPGTSITDATQAGVQIRAAITVQASPAQTVIVLGSSQNGSPPVASPTLFSASGVVLAQSSDKSLLSCDYHLSDSAAAQPFLVAAKAAAMSQGFASATQLDSDATIYFVSEDPTTAGRLLVTVDTIGPIVPGPAGTPTLHALKTFFALLSRTPASVVGTGQGTW